MVKQWYHFYNAELKAVVSVEAVDERAARGCLNLLLKFYKLEDWVLHSATYNRNGSPIL